MSIHLNRDAFIQKVFDFEKNSDWKYAGDKSDRSHVVL